MKRTEDFLEIGRLVGWYDSVGNFRKERIVEFVFVEGILKEVTVESSRRVPIEAIKVICD